MKTVYFKLANPPANTSYWEVAFTSDPTSAAMANWTFSGFQTIDKVIKVSMPDGADWVAFYAGLPNQQASYMVAYQGQTTFVNGATYIWDTQSETLTNQSAAPPSGGAPPVSGGDSLTDTLKKYAVPIGIAAVLVGVVLTRKK